MECLAVERDGQATSRSQGRQKLPRNVCTANFSARCGARLRKEATGIETELANDVNKLVDRLDLLEVCTPIDSLLAETVIKNGGTAERCGLYNGCDLTRKKKDSRRS